MCKHSHAVKNWMGPVFWFCQPLKLICSKKSIFSFSKWHNSDNKSSGGSMRIVLSYVTLIVLFTIMIVFAFEFGVRFAFRRRIQTQKYQSIFVHFINYYSPSDIELLWSMWKCHRNQNHGPKRTFHKSGMKAVVVLRLVLLLRFQKRKTRMNVSVVVELAIKSKWNWHK